MFCILLTQEGFLYRNLPINAKTIVLDGDTTICLWSIEVVALVLEDCSLREYGKAMCEASWYEELAMDSRCYRIAR